MSGIIDLFIPKEKRFFELLLKQVDALHLSALSLYELSLLSFNEKNISKALKEIESQNVVSDNLYMEIIVQVHKSFITPIDREELHYLTTSINEAVNSFEKIATTLSYLKLPEKPKDTFFINQVKLLKESIELIKNIFENPLNLKDNTLSIKEINSSQKKSQRELRKSLSNLFKENDPVKIIKLKELYETSTDSMSSLKKIVDIFERVLINHS